MPNEIKIEIVKKYTNEEVIVSEGSGLWTRYVQFDDLIYW